jgi:hypothetical protein
MLQDLDSCEAQEHDCNQCGWKGAGTELHKHAVTVDFLELRCPQCENCILLVLAPNVAESRAGERENAGSKLASE